MNVRDNINIEKVENGFQVGHVIKTDKSEYSSERKEYVFVTFDEVIEWIKLQA